MGFAEDAAGALTQVGDRLPVEQIMAVVQALDDSKAGLAQAGDKYMALFGSQLAGAQDSLIGAITVMQNVRTELGTEAARLLGGGV